MYSRTGQSVIDTHTDTHTQTDSAAKNNIAAIFYAALKMNTSHALKKKKKKSSPLGGLELVPSWLEARFLTTTLPDSLILTE